MRKSAILALVGLGLLASACATGGVAGRKLETYYDPAGQFSADLPAKDVVQVEGRRAVSSTGPTIVSGVTASPPQPPSSSSSASSGFTLTQPDQTVYRVLALSSDRYRTPQELTQFQQASAPPSGNLQVQQALTIDGQPGLLTVTDYPASSLGPAISVASGFVVRGPVAFWIFAIFPQGGWGTQQVDFLAILHSFHVGVRPGIGLLPMGRPPG